MYLTQNTRVALFLIVLLIAALLLAGIVVLPATHHAVGHILASAGSTPDIIDHSH